LPTLHGSNWGSNPREDATYSRLFVERCAFGDSRIGLTGLTSILPTAAGEIREAIWITSSRSFASIN